MSYYFDGLSPQKVDREARIKLSDRLSIDIDETLKSIEYIHQLLYDLDTIPNSTIKQVAEDKRNRAAKQAELQAWLLGMEPAIERIAVAYMCHERRRKAALKEASDSFHTSQKDQGKATAESEYRFDMLFYKKKELFLRQLATTSTQAVREINSDSGAIMQSEPWLEIMNGWLAARGVAAVADTSYWTEGPAASSSSPEAQQTTSFLDQHLAGRPKEVNRL